ncbi:MAG TPA: Gfo/Idh/MocA family oxidoreductase [Nocardioides sp.]|nr:Gfo/Idh/MocA family oxidoreductase [Nocardioides sp.]
MSTRIVMVGAGGVAQRHVAVLGGLPDVEVVGVVDPVEAAARALAESCGADVHASTAAALSACRADAVYVCVPPFAHGEPEREVLARGLPLFVEKPLSARWDVAEDLGRLVAEAGVVTGTGYHWRCLDTVEAARRQLEASPPLLASGYWLDKRPPVAWWPHSGRSGGQVVEQLTHVLDLARVLLGEATEVYAAGAVRAAPPTVARDDPPRGDVDDATAVTVRFASGAVATLAATSLLRAKHRAALHTFSDGLVLELSETELVVDDGEERRVVEPAEDPRVVVDREFVAAVRGERSATRAPYEEALRTHRLACAIATSARRAEPVRLDEAVGR